MAFGRIFKMVSAVGDLIMPRRCVSCGALSDGEFLCRECRLSVELRPQSGICRVCGRAAAASGEADFVCGACAEDRPDYDMARSAAWFSGPVRDMVHAFKYRGAVWLARELAELAGGCFYANWGEDRVDAVCPVPLFPSRLRSRGYNQAGLLAEELSVVTGIALMSGALVRTRNTPTQTEMNSRRRHENVRGAFAVPDFMADFVYGKTILVADDVMTTGATLSECAKALKKAGAGRVYALTVARD